MRVFLFSLVVIFFSFGVFKSIELEKSRETIKILKIELRTSEFIWIENLKLYSLIYSNYLKNKASILKKIDIKKSILIYRYSKFMCESCIQEDLLEIELLQKDIGKEKILLLPAFPDNRETKIELSNMLSKFNYVNLSIDAFIIPSQDGDFQQRYFAVIDNEGNLTMVFFPRRDETKLTRLYFSEVKKLIIE